MKITASNASTMLGALDRAIAVAKGSIEDMRGLATPATIERGQQDLKLLCEAFDKLELLEKQETQEALSVAISWLGIIADGMDGYSTDAQGRNIVAGNQAAIRILHGLLIEGLTGGEENDGA